MLDLLRDNTSLLLGAMNLVIVIVGLVVGGIYLFRYFYADSLSGFSKTITLGIASTAIGLATHRFYWTVQRLLESYGVDFASNLYVEWSWVTLIPLVLVILGYGLHLGPFFKPTFGRFWVVYYSVMVAILYFAFTILLSGVY